MSPQGSEPGAPTASPASATRRAPPETSARAGANASVEPWRRWLPWLLSALLALVAARFVRLDIDPPYGIISDGGEFLSDEGWYTQAAQVRARFGDWTSEYDLVWFSSNALFSFLYSVAFRIAGSTILVARTFSVLCSVVTLVAFYGLIRTHLSRAMSLATCLLTAVTVHTVGYSRIAIVEPTGVAVSMLALCAWVRFRRIPGSIVGILVGIAAYFVKASFLFTLCVMGFLALLDVVVLVRERRWRGMVAVLGTMLVAPFVVLVAQFAVNSVAPEQAAMFARWHLNWRVDSVTKGSSTLETIVREARYVARAFVKLPKVTSTYAPAAAALACLVWMTAKARGLPKLSKHRAVIAMAVWFVAGTTMFGLFDTQPIRYFLFAVYPLSFLAVVAVCHVVPEPRRMLAVTTLLAAHCIVQVPSYMMWLGREDLTTARDAARDVVKRMDLGAAETDVAVIGDTAAFVSLYDSRIRPLSYRGTVWLGDKVNRWRPRFLFDFPSRAEEMTKVCSATVARLERMATYPIMQNYCTEEDFALYRIVYR